MRTNPQKLNPIKLCDMFFNWRRIFTNHKDTTKKSFGILINSLIVKTFGTLKHCLVALRREPDQQNHG